MANIESKNLLVAVKAFARGNALPLDRDEVWESLSAAQTYAQSATAYAGQTIKALVDGKYKSYIIQPSDGGLTLEEQTGGGAGEGIAYVQIVEVLPETGQTQGVIYINTTTNSGHIWTGEAYKEIFRDVTVEISDLKNLVDTKANLDGATFTGDVILAADPTEDLGAVTKQYVDRLIGELNSSTPGIVDSVTPLPSEYKAGQAWRVAEAGIYAGQVCEIGDLIIAVADGTEIVDTNFIVVQANINGAVIGPEASTDANIVVFDGITGKIIKDSEVSLASLKDAIEKAHTHDNKDILDTFTKTETELVESINEGVGTQISDLQTAIDGKADVDTVYTKTEIDNHITTINSNLNTKVSASEVDTKINEAKEDTLIQAKAYTDERIGIKGSTVKDYVDAAIGTGGTDSAEAIAKALAEAKAYTDTSLTITEF